MAKVEIIPIRGEVPAQFDARRTSYVDAKADALIEYAKRVTDWPLLEQAVIGKIEEQKAFIEWWGSVVRDKGWPTQVSDRKPELSADDATKLTNITKLQVHKWKRRLEDPDAYKAMLYGAAYQAAMAAKDSMAVHYSSDDDKWETPQDLFNDLNYEFHFELDVCALPATAKCERFFSPDDDGLQQEWTGACWMNPPYGDVIKLWVNKARISAENGATVVCLLPARVDTEWWWSNCIQGEIRFLKGRLKFGGGETSAPFPSAIVVFGRESKVVWWDRGNDQKAI